MGAVEYDQDGGYEVIEVEDDTPTVDTERFEMAVAVPESVIHRHHEYVDHSNADHSHGICSDHAHWAGGTHPIDTPARPVDPENDPLGFSDESEGAVPEGDCRWRAMCPRTRSHGSARSRSEGPP